MSTSPQDSARMEALKNTALFAGFGASVLQELALKSRQISLSKGAAVFHAKEVSDEIYVVVQGKLEVSVNRSGRRVVLAQLSTGDYFGEMPLLTGEPRSATVSAVDECTLLEFSRPLWVTIFQRQPDLMDQMIRNLVARKRANTEVLQMELETQMTEIAQLSQESTSMLDRLRQMFGFKKEN